MVSGGSGVAWHATAPAALARLGATAGPAGVILGRDHSGDLTPVRILRPEPTRVVLVGGVWAARLVVFRSLALGTLVDVVSSAPGRWSALAELAGAVGRIRALPVTGGADAPPVAAGSLQPHLFVAEGGLAGAGERSLSPWQTTLTVLPVVTTHTAALVADADVALLQRMSLEEADLCAAALRLPPVAALRLQQLHDEMVVVVAGGVERYLWFAPTSVETEILGTPYR